MFDTWVCKLGGHDWEIVERKNEGSLIKWIEQSIYQNYDYRPSFTTSVLHRKVCLRCGLKVDEINDYVKDYVETRIWDKQRKKIARQMFSKGV